MTVSELFAVACGLSLLFLFASFWQGDDSGGGHEFLDFSGQAQQPYYYSSR